MDNTASSAPQLGLGKADLVVEELVEGGLTRLAAFYYSRLPAKVGPVRSMRASDIGIVSPVDATWSPAVRPARPSPGSRAPASSSSRRARRASPATPRRSAPYNLFADLTDRRRRGRSSGEARPADYLPWGDAKDLPQGQPATKIAATFSGGHTTNWTYGKGGYVNANTYAARRATSSRPTPCWCCGCRSATPATSTRPATRCPETKFTGTGQAMLFHDGRLVRGTWKKKSLHSALAALHEGRRADRARRSHLDRAGPRRRRAATSPSRSSRRLHDAGGQLARRCRRAPGGRPG